MWFLSGADVSLGVDYQVDGQFVVPDSATYQVRGPTGVLLSSGSLPALLTSEVLTIPSTHNGLSLGGLFEGRFVSVVFLVGVHHYTQQLSYQLSEFVPTTANPAGVRTILGLDISELPDADIDVTAAYFELTDTYGSGFTAGFLLAGPRALAANQAVVVQAALNVVGSLDLRVQAISKAEGHTATRFLGLDFEVIALRLRAQLATLIRRTKGDSAASSSIFILSNPTDILTGSTS